jgi:integrase
MSVRKREWKTRKGETKSAWVVAYVDQNGVPRIKTFKNKKPADAYHATVNIAVRGGMHTPDAESITVKQAGERWIRTGEANDLERATLDEYRRHLDLHIAPFLGAVKLSKLTTPMVTELRRKLKAGEPAPGRDAGTKRSPAMVKKIISSLSSILADAQENGLVAQNVVRSLTSRKKKGTKAEQRRKLKVGVDIPTRAEVKAIVGKLDGRWRPLLLTAIFTGLRASELRGLRWSDVDFKKGVLHVHQRADRYNDIGAPKSEAGERSVPIPSIVANTLREWKLACPKGELDLVFPNGAGRVENHGNIVNRGFMPVQIAAGVTDKDGAAKYGGLHALRHFYASWCINRKADGGLELPGKLVQQRLGHSSIVMTMDTYGHLFAAGDDGGALDEAERLLLA